jgi:hypothetical protein
MKKLAIIGTVVTAGALGLVGQAVAKPTASVNAASVGGRAGAGTEPALPERQPGSAGGVRDEPRRVPRADGAQRGLNKKYGLGTYSLTLERGSNERFTVDNPTKGTKAIGTNGRNLVASTPTDTTTDFAWDDAGIGAGVLLAVMAFATLGVLGARHHGRLGTSVVTIASRRTGPGEGPVLCRRSCYARLLPTCYRPATADRSCWRRSKAPTTERRTMLHHNDSEIRLSSHRNTRTG